MGSSRTRDRTHGCRTGRQILNHCTIREVLELLIIVLNPKTSLKKQFFKWRNSAICTFWLVSCLCLFCIALQQRNHSLFQEINYHHHQWYPYCPSFWIRLFDCQRGMIFKQNQTFRLGQTLHIYASCSLPFEPNVVVVAGL